MAERFRQNHEQRHGEERADGVADQPRHDLFPDSIVTKKKGRGDNDAAETAQDGQPNGPRERTHEGMITVTSFQLRASSV